MTDTSYTLRGNLTGSYYIVDHFPHQCAVRRWCGREECKPEPAFIGCGCWYEPHHFKRGPLWFRAWRARRLVLALERTAWQRFARQARIEDYARKQRNQGGTR